MEKITAYKLFIFSLSTELINFAKSLACVHAFTEDNCYSPDFLGKKIVQAPCFPCEVLNSVSLSNYSETPNSTAATNETFKLTDRNDVGFLSSVCVYTYVTPYSRDSRGITHIAGGEFDLNLHILLNNLQRCYNYI